MMTFSGWFFVQEALCPVGFLLGSENPGGFFPGGFCRVAFIRDPSGTINLVEQ